MYMYSVRTKPESNYVYYKLFYWLFVCTILFYVYLSPSYGEGATNIKDRLKERTVFI